MTQPRPAIGHMPFPGHRTQKQVREDEARYQIKRRMGAQWGGDCPTRKRDAVGQNARKTQVAEWMALRGGSVADCARSLNATYRSVARAWDRIRGDLGRQAR